ncbi:hypothetical protein F4775DRAFT_558060 [Biscogniauxia sp. FL1348]|nr:hypothetical protein F4775DRAFT_558060 [Biscogniauxia sp. FL1348]
MLLLLVKLSSSVSLQVCTKPLIHSFLVVPAFFFQPHLLDRSNLSASPHSKTGETGVPFFFLFFFCEAPGTW